MNSVLKHAGGVMLGMFGALALLSGCATPPHYVADGPSFREESAANLIVRYSAENAVFMLRPDMREGPFQRIFTREGLCREAAAQPGDRRLAVVILNHYHSLSLEQQDKKKWLENLGDLNFRRVVFLRGTTRPKIDGLRIVSDTLLSEHLPSEPTLEEGRWASVVPLSVPLP
jgi:hypothetical protein